MKIKIEQQQIMIFFASPLPALLIEICKHTNCKQNDEIEILVQYFLHAPEVVCKIQFFCRPRKSSHQELRVKSSGRTIVLVP